MVVKCFFRRNTNCLVYEKIRRMDIKIIEEPDMDRPKPDWCIPCLLWQILQEMKKSA